jgi:UDP-glucose 4-epimerase
LKILLVGGLGFIGKHIIRSMRNPSNLIVISSANSLTTNQSFVSELGLIARAADITNGEKLKEIIQNEKPAVVIHLAALTGI